MELNKDYAARMLVEILYEKGLVNKDTLKAVREKLREASALQQAA